MLFKHKILVLISYAQMPLINTHSYVFSKAKGPNFGLEYHLHPYLVYARSEGSEFATDSEGSDTQCHQNVIDRTPNVWILKLAKVYLNQMSVIGPYWIAARRGVDWLYRN